MQLSAFLSFSDSGQGSPPSRPTLHHLSCTSTQFPPQKPNQPRSSTHPKGRSEAKKWKKKKQPMMQILYGPPSPLSPVCSTVGTNVAPCLTQTSQRYSTASKHTRTRTTTQPAAREETSQPTAPPPPAATPAGRGKEERGRIALWAPPGKQARRELHLKTNATLLCRQIPNPNALPRGTLARLCLVLGPRNSAPLSTHRRPE
ncbi:hypothetical protein V8C26DRAFT_276998 [Trichoderma gracile]